MPAINSMNKANRCFEVCGSSRTYEQGYLFMVVCHSKAMNYEETETVNENAYRRGVRIKKHKSSGCNNRRSRCENKPKGYQFGGWYDRGNAKTMHSCLEREKSCYNGSVW